MDCKSNVYPNSPLVDVIFEVRFPGELSVECRRHDFWELIRRDYPEIHVPNATHGVPVALSPYHFTRSDRSASVQVALNRLSLSVKRYRGFQSFKREFDRIYHSFGNEFNINELTRIGWRCVNIIPFDRESGKLPLSRFLKLEVSFSGKYDESMSNKIGNIETLSFTLQRDEGTLLVNISTLKNPSTNQEALLLDIDYSETDNLIFDEIPRYLDKSHASVKAFFEDVITEGYRYFLNGEAIQ